MKNPMFSIIVPIYCVEKYLKDCLDSIRNQTFKNFEAILVDDGSPDECPEICDYYSQIDGRLKVIHKKNGGIIDARKTGVTSAMGEYIVFLDGDDWLANTYLEKYAEVITKYNPDIICSGYFASHSNKIRKRELSCSFGYYDKDKIINLIYPKLIEDEHGEYFRPQLWAKAFRTTLYKEQQQVSGQVSVGEDHACTKPCIYHANSIYMMEKCLYYYRINENSITKKPQPYYWEGPKAIGEHFEKQIDMNKYDFQDQVYRNVTHNLFNVAVSQFNKQDKYLNIKKDIIQNLSDEYYTRAICKCKYKDNWKGISAKF
ncbi:TPA: glycosyltransferase family 2 protein, partial [Enterococcus faecium]|nr:glycosyltransferase family 2 protein [Enterococcus faecium]